MKRHQNRWLNTFDDDGLLNDIQIEMTRRLKQFGRYNTPHEMASVIREEFEEFWESVKNNDPDPEELLQLCAVTKQALIELCELGRKQSQQSLKEG